MVKPKIYDKWTRERTMEKGGGERITDTTGFVPPKLLIKSYMDAGERLQNHREELYGVPPVEVTLKNKEEIEEKYRKLEDDLMVNPARSKGYTQVDASEDIRNLKPSLERIIEKNKVHDGDTGEPKPKPDIPADGKGEGRPKPEEAI